MDIQRFGKFNRIIGVIFLNAVEIITTLYINQPDTQPYILGYGIGVKQNIVMPIDFTLAISCILYYILNFHKSPFFVLYNKKAALG